MWLLFYCASLKDKTCFICTTNLLVSFLNISSLNTLPRSLCIYTCYNHLWNVFLTYRSFHCIYTLKNNVLTLKSNIYIKQFKQSIKKKTKHMCYYSNIKQTSKKSATTKYPAEMVLNYIYHSINSNGTLLNLIKLVHISKHVFCT